MFICFSLLQQKIWTKGVWLWSSSGSHAVVFTSWFSGTENKGHILLVWIHITLGSKMVWGTYFLGIIFFYILLQYSWLYSFFFFWSLVVFFLCCWPVMQITVISLIGKILILCMCGDQLLQKQSQSLHILTFLRCIPSYNIPQDFVWPWIVYFFYFIEVIANANLSHFVHL